MENLTQTYGVVKPNMTPAPLEGHKVVVFEETMGGTKLVAILNPGDNPYKRKFHLFSSSPSYSCYAVNSDTKLNFDFTTEMILSAQHQHFILNCAVYYHVSDPGPMALTFKTDPIMRIREEIKKRLQRNILQSKILIEDIRDDFFEQKDKILPSTTLNQLRDFVRAFGVIINEIDMTYKIPEKYLKPDLKKEDYFLEKETDFIEVEKKLKQAEEEKEKLIHQHEIRKIEIEHELEEKLKKKEAEMDGFKYQNKFRLMQRDYEKEEQEHTHYKDKKDTHHTQEMEDVKSFHEFRREMPKRLITAIDKAIEHIDGAGSLERVAESAIGVIKRAANEIQNPDQALSGKQLPPIATHMNVLMVESAGPFDEAKALLLKILTKVENSSSQPEERKALLACITHLLAEIQLEEKANPAMVDQYIKELNKYAVKYAKIFTRSVMEQISELKDDLKSHTQDARDNSNTSEDTKDDSHAPGSTTPADKEINHDRNDNSATPAAVSVEDK